MGCGDIDLGHFARVSHTPAFNARDIADLSAICTHLSVSFARLKVQPLLFSSSSASRLTQRELEIAELVARGLTNTEIGAVLWITQNSVKQALKRMFRKLDVSTRAQMVARLREELKSPEANR